VITGTTSSRKLSTDVALAAKSTANSCYSDGEQLDEIVALFQNESKEMPVAIIQNGLRQREK
jgi:uroporphyrin-III C-methyltransferase